MKDSSRTKSFQESRRSTRVPLKVLIRVEDNAESLTCEGETVVVNMHGALLTTAQPLKLRSHIVIQVHLTGKQAAAEVAYVDSDDPLSCGVALVEPRNIWGVSLPPEDWVASLTDPEH